MFIIYIKIHYNDIIMHQTNHNRRIDWGRIEILILTLNPLRYLNTVQLILF